MKEKENMFEALVLWMDFLSDRRLDLFWKEKIDNLIWDKESIHFITILEIFTKKINKTKTTQLKNIANNLAEQNKQGILQNCIQIVGHKMIEMNDRLNNGSDQIFVLFVCSFGYDQRVHLQWQCWRLSFSHQHFYCISMLIAFIYSFWAQKYFTWC